MTFASVMRSIDPAFLIRTFFPAGVTRTGLSSARVASVMCSAEMEETGTARGGWKRNVEKSNNECYRCDRPGIDSFSFFRSELDDPCFVRYFTFSLCVAFYESSVIILLEKRSKMECKIRQDVRAKL